MIYGVMYFNCDRVFNLTRTCFVLIHIFNVFLRELAERGNERNTPEIKRLPTELPVEKI